MYKCIYKFLTAEINFFLDAIENISKTGKQESIHNTVHLKLERITIKKKKISKQ